LKTDNFPGGVIMSIDRIVLAVAGTVVILSVLLAVYVNINFLWLTGFVGLNLLQSAFTGFCPLALILKKFGVKAGCAFE
jgi:hypothetical protein